MWRATWRSLLGHKLRLLLSTLAIVFGVAFVSGSFIFTDTLGRSFTAIFASGVGDVVVRPVGAGTDAQTSRSLPASLVTTLATAPGAARADGNVTSFGLFVVGSNGKVVGGQGAPGIALNLTGAPAGHGIASLTVTAGHAPHGAGEVALDPKTAQRAGYHLGDRVRLVSVGKRALLQPTLVGLVTYGDGGSTNGATISVLDTRTAQQQFLDGKDRFTDAWVTADSGVSQDELKQQVETLLPRGYEALTGDEAADESGDQLKQAISFISTFLLIFAGIALVVGSFLIVNTFSILVAQRSRELALLRALGASRRQVTRSVLGEALVIGLLGSTFGLGLGVVMALGIQALFAAFGLDLSGSGLVFAPRTAIAAYAVGILVTLVAAYLPARRSSRIPPVAALRDDVAMPESTLRRRVVSGTVLGVAGVALMLCGLFLSVPQPGYWVGSGILAALLGAAAASPVIGRPFLALSALVYRRAFGTVGALAGQNALRNPRRTAATASALMIGLALVTTMAIVGASSKASVDATIAEDFQGDLVVSNVVGSAFSPSIGDRIEHTPGVAAVTRFRYASATVAGQDESIMAVSAASLAQAVRVPLEAGSLSDLRDGTVMVTAKRAAALGLHVGDQVRLTMPRGSRSYRVAAIAADNNPVLYAPFAFTLHTLVQAGFSAQDNLLMVTKAAGASTHALQATIDRQTADLPTVTVKDQAGYAAEQRGQLDQLLILIYLLLALALVIAVLGIVNTLALSVIERTRELGLLRAIGLARRQLRRMVRLEAVVIAVLGALLGVAMGVVFGVALMVALRDQGLEVIDVPVVQLAVFVVGSGVVGVLAAVVPAFRAARLDVLRAIAME